MNEFSLSCAGLSFVRTGSSLQENTSVWRLNGSYFVYYHTMILSHLTVSTYDKISFFPFLKEFLFNVWVSACTPACQKRAQDFTIDGCEPPCNCWELNSRPLEGQPVLLTTEPTLQPSSHVLYLPQSTHLSTEKQHCRLRLIPQLLNWGLHPSDDGAFGKWQIMRVEFPQGDWCTYPRGLGG